MRPPVTVLVTYRPKKGKEARFVSLLRRHWPALDGAGLVAGARPRIWRARDKRTGRVYFVEIFDWKSAKASEMAHRTPGVTEVWDSMEALIESMEVGVITPMALPFTAK